MLQQKYLNGKIPPKHELTETLEEAIDNSAVFQPYIKTHAVSRY